jgi:FSR family fosmidomycin resistance protein-like MFS transporter
MPVMDTQDRKTLGVVSAAHTLVHLIEGALPPLIPLLLGVFGTDYFHLGMVMSVFSYTFGLGAFPSGALVDRVGPTRLLVLYLFGAGILCLSVLFVQKLLPFAILLGFLGILGSFYHPAANTIISLGIKERGKAFGINGIAGSLGTSLVPFVAAFLGARWGWKSPYVLFGIGVLIVGFFALSLPSYRMQPADRKADSDDGTARGANRIITKALVLFYLSCGLAGMGNRGVLTFLPSYLGSKFTLTSLGLDSVRVGGIFATLTLIAGAAGQYIAGALVDRYRPQRLYIVTLLISSASILLMSFTGGLPLFLGAVGFGFFSFAVQPMQNTIGAKLLPKHRQGIGYGFMFFMTFGIGSVAAAFSGWLADRFGLSSVFLAMGLCYVASMGTMYGAEWKVRRQEGSR